ncbi:C2H2-type zinc finger transcription factor [Phycomyces blakesleeanus]
MSQPVDAIDRTPEYEEFMRRLKEFHEKKGSVLQPEPVLGGKKLDLYLIYKTVLEAGGYDKVTLNRGWKQVGDPFNFPPTCTNSAYILKGVFTKNLLGWEEEDFWKRPWNPPKDMVDQKQNTKTGSPLVNGTNAKQRDSARQTATAFTQPAYNPSVYNNRQPYSYNPTYPGVPAPYYPTGKQHQHPLLFPPPPPSLPLYHHQNHYHNQQQQQQQQQQYQQQHQHQQAMFMDEEFRTRILLALKSNLPNEVDWAFNTLIKFSFISENFSLDFMPVLLDLLLGFADPFFDRHVRFLMKDYNNNRDEAEEAEYEVERQDDAMFSTKEDQELFERVLQVFHILRNFSFLDINVRRLAHQEKLRQMLLLGITLPPDSQYAELTRHCLDILENIAPQVIVNSPNHPFLTIISGLLFTNDRALILGAIRWLTRVAVTEINERVLSVANPNIVDRLAQLLLVDDEELTAATLEYFYQYSGLHGDFSIQLVQLCPGNLIGLLVGFLSYKSSLVPASASVNSTIHGIPSAQLSNPTNNSNKQKPQQTAPLIPDLTNYAHLDEPYRCLGWLKERLESATIEDTLILKAIYSQYQTLFGLEKPLGVKEFYTVLKIAFPQPPSVEATVASGAAPLEDLVLHNIKYAPAKRPEGLDCRWRECELGFETESDLHRHILDDHIGAENTDGENTSSPSSPASYACCWMTCDRSGFPTRQAIIQHMRTHFAAKPSKPQPAAKKRDFVIDSMPMDDSEVSGVPLTAALLLRNLVKYKQHHEYYIPYESELTQIAVQRPRLAKYILAVLSALEIS